MALMPSPRAFLLSGVTHCWHVGHPGSIPPLPHTLCPSVRLETLIPAEKTNLYLDEWRRRGEARSMYRY